MGHRTLKRVPLDFAHPIGEIWEGYINPHHSTECILCGGIGYNPETKAIADTFFDLDGFGSRWTYEYGVSPEGKPAVRPPWRILGDCQRWSDHITQDEVEALVAGGRLADFTHRFDKENGWVQKQWDTPGFWCPQCHTSVPQLSPDHLSGLCTECNCAMELLPGEDIRLQIPSAEEVNAWERSGGMGHDTINHHLLIETRAKRLGVYGLCEHCAGEGSTFPNEDMQQLCENWQATEPPSGPGYQLWETVTEGSPLSPVFPSRLGLAKWCVDHATIGPNQSLTATEWYKLFLQEDGVEAASIMVGFRPPDGRFYMGAEAKAPSQYIIDPNRIRTIVSPNSRIILP